MAGDLLSFLPDVGPPENRIIIPKLNLNVPLVTPSYQNLLSENWTGVEEDIQDALQHGIVHYPGTARPGQAGNFFVTGHSSYYPWAPGKYKNVFARLHEIDVGDEYWVYYGGDKHRYVVREKQEVKPSNVRVLDQPLDKRTATLMTCTPVGTTLRRLIVTAEEVDSITGMPLEVGEKGSHGGQKLNVEQLPI
jgi:sortase A